MRIADSRWPGLAQMRHTLRAARCQPVTIIGHPVKGIETDRLGRDIDPFDRIVEAVHAHDIGRLVDRMEIDRLVGPDDEALAIGLAPHAIFVVHHHQRFDFLAHVHRHGAHIARFRSDPRDMRVQFRAESIDLRLVAFDELVAARCAGFLVQHHDVERGEARHPVHRRLVHQCFAPDHRNRGLGVERHQLEAWPEVFDDVIDRFAPAPGDDLVEILRAKQDPLGRFVPAAPIDGGHGLHDRMGRIDIGHDPQQCDHGERVGGRHLEQVDAFYHRPLRDRFNRDARRIARQHMDQPRRVGAHEALAPGKVLFRHPFIERARIGKILRDDGLQRLPVEVVTGIFGLLRDHFAREDMGRAHPVDAFAHERIVRVADALAQFGEESDDLGQRHVEQRRHGGPWRDYTAQRDLRRRKADPEVARTLDLIIAFHQFAADEERRRNSVFDFRDNAHDTPRT